MKFKSVMAASLVLLAVVTEGAGEPPADRTTGLRSDMESILWFEGHWEGLVSLWVNGKTHIVNYHVDFKKSSDGKTLVEDATIIHPELGSLKRESVIAYNEITRNIRWIRTDVLGKVRVYFGGWESRDHFSFQTEDREGGSHFVEKIDFYFTDRNRCDAYQIATLNGRRVEVDSGYFSRQ